jgi:F-type H+-transporting ATPase subunit delta
MKHMNVARRYAKALFEEAGAAAVVEKVDANVVLITDAIAGSRELARFFESPLISSEKKHAIIDRLFRERVTPVVLRLLHLMVEKKREELFPAVLQAYRALRDEQLGIIEARVTAANALSKPEQEQLRLRLEDMSGKQVRLQLSEQPSLIGGAVVRIGDTVYNGSVRNQLNVLRRQLERETFRSN